MAVKLTRYNKIREITTHHGYPYSDLGNRNYAILQMDLETRGPYAGKHGNFSLLIAPQRSLAQAVPQLAEPFPDYKEEGN